MGSSSMGIRDNYQRLRESIPGHVEIVVAAKTRTADEVAAVIDAGARHIGENYVQEAMQLRQVLGSGVRDVTWHMIGHLQKNKINKALVTFDVIQSVDSVQSAEAIDKRAEAAGRQSVPVLLEINIGSEYTKSGLAPAEHEPFEEYMEDCARQVCRLEHIRLQGLMTMGPRVGDPEQSRPYFRRVRKIYDRLSTLGLDGAEMRYLSMGMTNSYKVAIEEGSNMVRIGTAVFGARD
ncbi:MAG: YggS family pyridoxal phosphate-dependent enzyme [Phycisphaerae bacterium]